LIFYIADGEQMINKLDKFSVEELLRELKSVEVGIACAKERYEMLNAYRTEIENELKKRQTDRFKNF